MGFLFQKSSSRKTSTAKTELLHQLGCSVCPLNCNKAKTPRMEASGATPCKVYALGVVPSAVDDRRSGHFRGAGGQFLRGLLPSGLAKQIRYNTIVRTYPERQKITKEVIECCRPSVVQDIEQAKPEVIWGFGKEVLEWISPLKNLYVWQGRRILVKVGNHVCWFIPFMHPEDIVEKANKSKFHAGRPERTQEGELFTVQIKAAVKQIGKLPPAVIEQSGEDELTKGVTIYTGKPGDLGKVATALNRLQRYGKPLGYDVETNRLRPYKAGTKLLSVAIGTYEDTVAIALNHREAQWSKPELRKLNELLLGFLLSPQVKIGHNTKFDLEWTAYFLGEELIHARDKNGNTVWGDTDAQAYVLHQRGGETSLNDLCVQYFGLPLKQMSNVNRGKLDQAPLEDVLRYNALDTKYTHKLYHAQMREIEAARMQQVYVDQINRIPAVVGAQLAGLPVNVDQVRRYQRQMQNKIKRLEESRAKIPELVAYEERHGKLNFNSHPQLMKFYKGWMKNEVVIAANSTAKAVLEKLDDPVSELITKQRHLLHLKGTYIDSWLPGGELLYPDHKLHTDYRTTHTDTRRLSSRNPNAQNAPSREDGWIRKQVQAPPGYLLCSGDYSQIEVCVIAMASEDPVLLDATRHSKDIHLKWTQRLAEEYPPRIGGERNIGNEAVMKKFRTDVKNQWTFPSFYGASSKSIAGYLHIPLDIVAPLHEEFWEEFAGVKAWQQRMINTYKRKGYVEGLTGWRRHGPMSINMIINTPIQNTASDIVVDAMRRMTHLAHDLGKPYLQPILNIHDDLTYLFPIDIYEEAIEFTAEQMLSPPFSFCITPLNVKFTTGPDWYNQTVYKTYKGKL